MNISHMKYVVEIAKAGTIKKASENLLIAQPNLSRTIKELENELGIIIFDRSVKGVCLTPEGEEFVSYAKNILRQFDDLEMMYKSGIPVKQKFSVSVPRASYISDAFASFSKSIEPGRAEIFYEETNNSKAINNIINSNYNLGIIRYASDLDKYYKVMLEEKGLSYELVSEFNFILVMNQNCPLAQKTTILFSDLEEYIEISHADPLISSLPISVLKRTDEFDNAERKIYVFERASQFDLLSENPETFMWVSPIPGNILKKHGLVQKHCPENSRMFRDVLIYKKDYKLSELDKAFITEVCASKRLYL
ncbi:MAG: LysR family transcriptional regulator [Clostridia bacterium]|nr:LysR family transcriptional regulator [Clostridia bacterium]